MVQSYSQKMSDEIQDMTGITGVWFSNVFGAPQLDPRILHTAPQRPHWKPARTMNPMWRALHRGLELSSCYGNRKWCISEASFFCHPIIPTIFQQHSTASDIELPWWFDMPETVENKHTHYIAIIFEFMWITWNQNWGALTTCHGRSGAPAWRRNHQAEFGWRLRPKHDLCSIATASRAKFQVPSSVFFFLVAIGNWSPIDHWSFILIVFAGDILHCQENMSQSVPPGRRNNIAHLAWTPMEATASGYVERNQRKLHRLELIVHNLRTFKRG